MYICIIYIENKQIYSNNLLTTTKKPRVLIVHLFFKKKDFLRPKIPESGLA